MKKLSLKAIERIFREMGAERISKEAKTALREFLEEKGKDTAKLAIRNALHSGRKEIKRADVAEAVELLG